MVASLEAAAAAPEALAGTILGLMLAVGLLVALRRPRSTSSHLWRPSNAHGFLPATVPPPQPRLLRAEELLTRLPELVSDHSVTEAIATLPEVDLPNLLAACATPLEAEMLAEWAALVYAFLGYAYLRGDAVLTLPRTIAVPWHAAAAAVGRAPTLDYVATVLANPAGIATFTGLEDERFFYEHHVRIERAAAPAVGALARASSMRWRLSPTELTRALEGVAIGVKAMAELLPEMAVGCGPEVFHGVIRDCLAGIGGRVEFEGVRDVDGAPYRRTLTGASGAQSAVMPCVDAFLGIGHAGRHELQEWSGDALAHLPPPHRALLLRLRARAPGSTAVVQRTIDRLGSGGGSGGGWPVGAATAKASAEQAEALRAAHGACIEALGAFRKAHMALVRSYIIQPDKAARPGSPTTIVSTPPLLGTGGSELSGFLSGRLLDTVRAGLGRCPVRPPAAAAASCPHALPA